MSHTRLQQLRLHKTEERLREFRRDEVSSAQTYRQYNELTHRTPPDRAMKVVTGILNGTLR